METKKQNKFLNWVKKNKLDLIIYFGFILTIFILITLAVGPQYKKINTNEAFNPTALRIAKFEIQWYAIFILSGIVLAAIMASYEFKRFGWKTEDLLDGLLIIVPLSIIGARLYYVLFLADGDITSIGQVFAIWEGGLAIHGAIIVATIGAILFSRRKKLNIWVVADILAVGLLMGQITGRWGNFMNAEAHGGETSNKFLFAVLPKFIHHQMQFSSYKPNLFNSGLIYQPTFLYESLWNFIGFTALMIVRRKRILKTGDILGIYLIWYGFGRGVLVEPLRTDQLMIFGMPVNIILSLILFVGGGTLLLILKRVINKNEEYYYDLAQYNEINIFNKEGKNANNNTI